MVMFKLLRRLYGNDAGATAIEYGLIVALVVIAMIASMSKVANESTELWTTISEKSKEAIDKVES